MKMTETIKDVMETLIEYANGGVSGLYPPEDDIQELVDYILDLQEEIERLHSIIKEVREYIEALKIEDYDSNAYFIQDKYDKWLGIEEIPNKLLEILDKVEEKK